MRLPFFGLFTAAVAALPIGKQRTHVAPAKLPIIATPLTPSQKHRANTSNDSRAFAKQQAARRAGNKRARVARRVARSR